MSLTQLKNQLLGIMKQTESRFVLKIDEAYTIEGRGTVLSGALYGYVRAGSSVGCLMDATTLTTKSEDLDVLVLQHYENLLETMQAWEQPLGCGILVKELPNPESLAGMIFCGGYRVPQTGEMSDIADEMYGLREGFGDAKFAMRIQDVFDLGNGETGLVGYLQGVAVAGKDVACLYEAHGEYPLSDPVRVKSLLYRRHEENVLVSDYDLLPCGVVIAGTFDPEMLRGEMLIEWSKLM